MIKEFDKNTESSSEPDTRRKGQIFLEAWHGQVFSKLEIRGIVTGVVKIGTGGYQYSIDDGSGRISAVAWDPDGPQALPKVPPESYYNKYVSITGSLTGFRTEIQIRIESINIIAETEEPVEEQLWWLEVKEEWEDLASRSTIMSSDTPFCPCLCHAGTGKTDCKTLGDPSSWPSDFNKAVAVIKSALRSMPTDWTDLQDIIKMLRENQKSSASLPVMECLPDCAGVEAVRQLIQSHCAELLCDGRLRISNRPVREDIAPLDSSSDLNRYPMTPAETFLTQVPKSQDHVRALDLRVPKEQPRGVPKFFPLVDGS
jgi:hypothetical protein